MAPSFVTERLVVRPWRDDDVEAWVAMNTDPRVMQFFPRIDARADLEATAQRLRDNLERDGYGWWVVEHRQAGTYLGALALSELPADLPIAPGLEIGWRFIASMWGNGYASEGARALLDFAFSRLRRDEIVAMTARLNHRSQRVMERIGMRRDSASDFDHSRVPLGHPVRPHVVYRLTRDRWSDNGAASNYASLK